MTATLEQIIAEMRAWVSSDTKLDWTMIKKEECTAILSALSEATSEIGRLKRFVDCMLPVSADGNYVFIDGPGDVEIDHGGRLRTRAETAERKLAEAERERDALQSAQPYLYIGKDGRPILARDLESQRDAALEALKPFAEVCACIELDHPDYEDEAIAFRGHGAAISMGELRAARISGEQP